MPNHLSAQNLLSKKEVLSVLLHCLLRMREDVLVNIYSLVDGVELDSVHPSDVEELIKLHLLNPDTSIPDVVRAVVVEHVQFDDDSSVYIKI